MKNWEKSFTEQISEMSTREKREARKKDSNNKLHRTLNYIQNEYICGICNSK